VSPPLLDQAVIAPGAGSPAPGAPSRATAQPLANDVLEGIRYDMVRQRETTLGVVRRWEKGGPIGPLPKT